MHDGAGANECTNAAAAAQRARAIGLLRPKVQNSWLHLHLESTQSTYGREYRNINNFFQASTSQETTEWEVKEEMEEIEEITKNIGDLEVYTTKKLRKKKEIF